MKKKIYLSIFLISLLTVGFSFYSANKNLNISIQNRAKQIYKIRKKEYNVIYNDKKYFLDAFAKFLSSSDLILNGYLENNRTKIINFVKPLYKNLYPNLIEEIHFFKRPALSFVNFANLKVYNQDVSKARADILWVDTSFTPSTHFYICRLYPGLRATYPIIYKDKLLGSISFGMSVKVFQKLFEDLNASVSIYLKDSNLKTFLLNEKYEQFKQYPIVDGYRIIGKSMNVSLNNNYELRDNYIYTKIKTMDFFNNTFAYIIIKDDISNFIINLKNNMNKNIIYDILNNLIILLIVFFLFRWIFKKTNKLDKILQYIKLHQFDKIPRPTILKDEFSQYENNLIDVGEHLKNYIEILTQKAEKYEIKAYKDGLTEAFNRTFLEDKSKSLFLKFKMLEISVGIVMIDIDDFKKVNDKYGHDVGDLVLVNLSKTIRDIIRKDDFFIRYGGEEFLIILQESNIQNSFKIAEKIRESIEKMIIKINDEKIKFTISLGITEIYLEDERISESIKRADINLYKAKRAGKNRVKM